MKGHDDPTIHLRAAGQGQPRRVGLFLLPFWLSAHPLGGGRAAVRQALGF